MKLFRVFRFSVLCFLGALQVFEAGAEEGVSVGAKSESGVASSATSLPAVGSKFAVISLKDVAKNSKAGRSIDDQLEEINNKSKEDLLGLENSIKKMDSDAKTSSDERKVDDLQAILYDMTKKKRYEIQSAFRSAIGVLEEEIHKVVKEIANDKGYSLIISSDAVFYSNSSECPDVTEEAIRRLDDRIPMIKVDMSKKNPTEG